MTRRLAPWLLAASATLALAPAPDDEPGGPFSGDWRTTISDVHLTQTGDRVTGCFGSAGQFPIRGTVKDNVLTFEYEEGAAKGEGRFTLDRTGHAFTGTFQVKGGRSGRWDGWRPDPDATKGDPARFAGLWLTGLGLMELEQDGFMVKGRYAVRGTSAIEGDVTGRRLEFRFKSFRAGQGWFDQAADGKSMAGAARVGGAFGWFGWRCRPAPEFVRHAKLAAGRVVDGSTKNLLTYAARAPEGYEEGSDRKWPTVVLLHGSNMNGRAYVATFADAWPELAREVLLIGVNGETPSDLGAEPRFNYTYVNYMGRSTYNGYPGTDRESPALVAEALRELRTVYPVDHYLVGGHSQGGYLTYCLLMHFPELLAGAFPVSAGLLMQCEPDVFDDKALREAQRAVPLAVVHGRNDPLVGFSGGEYAATQFGEAGWPALRFFPDDRAGHMFARLPVGPAVRWLESLASRDPKTLLDFAETRAREGADRDALAALRRARALELDRSQKERADALALAVEDRAAERAKALLPRIKENKDGSWVDDALAFRDAYEFTDAGREVMAAFNALRAEHAGRASALLAAARHSFSRGDRDGGYANYREIVETYYAAPSYRNVKRWLAERR